MRTKVLYLLVLLTFFESVIADEPYEYDAEAASVVNALRDNAAGVVTLDLSAKFEKFNEIEGVQSEHTQHRWRQISDFSNNRHLAVAQWLSPQKDREDSSIVLVAAVTFDGKTRYRNSSGRTRDYVSDSACAALIDASILDFRWVGIRLRAQSYDTRAGRSFDLFDRSFGFNKLKKQGKNSSSTIRFALEFTEENEATSGIRWEVDAETLVVDSLTEFHRGVDLRSETFRWEQRNGVFVPRDVLGTQKGRQFHLGKIVPYDTSDLTEFDWHSVNEPIADAIFDFNVIDDTDRLLSMLPNW